METGIATVLSTALTGIASDMTGAIATVLPIALPVMGGILVVRYGVKIFKSFAK